MKFDIKNPFSDAVLFTLECGSLKLCLEGAVKGGADLGEADLRGADLREADLREVDLGAADLSEANLSEANLGGANLGGAYLREANLRGAYLSGANLSGANLSEADLLGYKIDGKIGIVTAGDPNNWPAFGFVVEKTAQLRVQVGCRNKEINDGRAYWASDDHPEQENRREVLAALDYIETVAKLRGWNS